MGFDAADPSPRPGGFWSTLFQRNFALLWFGGLASYIGDWAMLVALPLFVFEQTGSTLAAGSLLTAKFAPMLFSSVAGVFVDRWDRRRILVRANLAMTVLTLPLLIPVTSAAESASLWIVYLSVIATSLAGLVVKPAENSLLPTLVGRDRLMVANSLNALNDNIARIAGPALGGLIAAYAGFAGVVIVNAACYAGAALLVALIRISPTSTPNRDDGQASPRATQAVSSITRQDKPAPKFPDLLRRDFTATAPNTRWVGDMTEIPTAAGKLYLATVIDLYSRRLLGAATGLHPDADLACQAITMAVAARGGAGQIRGVIFHTDRGSTYTANNFTKLCRRLKISQSIPGGVVLRQRRCRGVLLQPGMGGPVRDDFENTRQAQPS